MNELLIVLVFLVVFLGLGNTLVWRVAYTKGLCEGRAYQLRRCIAEIDELAERRWQRLVSQQQEKEKSNISDCKPCQ